MRLFSVLMVSFVTALPVLAQEVGEISSSTLSRCAGKAGIDVRRSDAAFGILALDGVPWATIERTDSTVGTQPITTTVTSTGGLLRRNGTLVPFRFTCVLDADGQALMFHASQLMLRLGDELPPSIVVDGSATYLEEGSLPRGIELQVQLLDTSRGPAGEILAEQVVRSGWSRPIPFALRLPKSTSLEARKIAITARFVLAHKVLFQLKEPRAIASDDFGKSIDLTLDKVAAAKH